MEKKEKNAPQPSCSSSLQSGAEATPQGQEAPQENAPQPSCSSSWQSGAEATPHGQEAPQQQQNATVNKVEFQAPLLRRRNLSAMEDPIAIMNGLAERNAIDQIYTYSMVGSDYICKLELDEEIYISSPSFSKKMAKMDVVAKALATTKFEEFPVPVNKKAWVEKLASEVAFSVSDSEEEGEGEWGKEGEEEEEEEEYMM